MAEVRVRKLDDLVVLELKERAQREKTSVEALLREVITAEAKRPRQEMVDRLKKRHEEFHSLHGLLPDSTDIIREERERWS